MNQSNDVTAREAAAAFVGDNEANLAFLFAQEATLTLEQSRSLRDHLLGALSCFIPSDQFAGLVSDAAKAVAR